MSKQMSDTQIIELAIELGAHPNSIEDAQDGNRAAMKYLRDMVTNRQRIAERETERIAFCGHDGVTYI